MKEHEGFVDVASEKGRGTTFTLYFPLAEQSPHFARENDSVSESAAGDLSEKFGIATREAPSAVHGRFDSVSNPSNPSGIDRPTKLGS